MVASYFYLFDWEYTQGTYLEIYTYDREICILFSFVGYNIYLFDLPRFFFHEQELQYLRVSAYLHKGG